LWKKKKEGKKKQASRGNEQHKVTSKSPSMCVGKHPGTDRRSVKTLVRKGDNEGRKVRRTGHDTRGLLRETGGEGEKKELVAPTKSIPVSLPHQEARGKRDKRARFTVQRLSFCVENDQQLGGGKRYTPKTRRRKGWDRDTKGKVAYTVRVKSAGRPDDSIITF